MGKTLKMIFGGVLICILGIMMVGCGKTDHFVGRWTESQDLEKPQHYGYVMEITKNGDKEYIGEWSIYYYNAEKDECVKNTEWEGPLIINTENTIQSTQNPNVMVIYNVEKKCLQFNTGNGLKDFIAANDDKTMNSFREQIKKGYETTMELKSQEMSRYVGSRKTLEDYLNEQEEFRRKSIEKLNSYDFSYLHEGNANGGDK